MLPETGRRPTLGDQIYARLREAIVTLEWLPGQMLYENELSERLGVSRTPVREAIRLLASERLVDVLPQRGTRVTLISLRTVKEVQFIREQLESGAFREAARRWDPDLHGPVRDRLEANLREQAQAAEAGDLPAFFRLDEAFHRLIMGVAGNETLLALIDRMRAHLNRVRFLSLKDERDEARILGEHRELLDAVASGHEERTVRLLMAHIGKMDSVLRRLESRHPDYFVP
jgi:DNA-binding GntR family transcriptional regulator